MPEGVGYGPQNTASTGFELNYVGNHCYAYSGAVDCNNTADTLLEFTTGASYIDAVVQCSRSDTSSDDFMFQIYINGLFVFAITTHRGASHNNDSQGPAEFIIPPFTSIKITAKNTSSASARSCNAKLTGRVYK